MPTVSRFVTYSKAHCVEILLCKSKRNVRNVTVDSDNLFK